MSIKIYIIITVWREFPSYENSSESILGKFKSLHNDPTAEFQSTSSVAPLVEPSSFTGKYSLLRSACGSSLDMATSENGGSGRIVLVTSCDCEGGRRIHCHTADSDPDSGEKQNLASRILDVVPASVMLYITLKKGLSWFFEDPVILSAQTGMLRIEVSLKSFWIQLWSWT